MTDTEQWEHSTSNEEAILEVKPKGNPSFSFSPTVKSLPVMMGWTLCVVLQAEHSAK